MGALLYLDTARLGRMSPAARLAVSGLAQIAAEEGALPQLERFLLAGADADLPDPLRCFAERSGWRGIGVLKASLRTLGGSHPELPVLLAARSAQMMKLAARLLFHPCRNVLVTDLGWLSVFIRK